MDKTITEEIKCILKVFNKEGLIVFADYGTLLGAVRHKGFIPWDKDFDFGVKIDKDEVLARKKFLNLFNSLKNEGFAVGSTQRKMQPINIKNAMQNRFVVKGKGMPIDFFPWYLKGEAWERKKYLQTDKKWNKGKEIKQEWVDEIIHLPFENIQIPVPKGYVDLLNHRYGDWKNPVNYYEKNK